MTVASGEMLRLDRSPVESRFDGREPDPEADVGGPRHNVKKARSRHDYVENAYIRALDAKKMRYEGDPRDRFVAELTRAMFRWPI